MLHLDVVSIFPEMFRAVTEFGVTGRAWGRGLFSLVLWNQRDFTADPHRTVDDRPYGGGPGMVMLAAPLGQAIEAARRRQASCGVHNSRVIHLSPQGSVLDHRRMLELSREPGLILLAGRYEGVDERLIARQVNEEIAIGDYVVSGGELPAMVLIDGIVRQLPGVLGDADSVLEDSFVDGLLDCPHYTRPEVYEGIAVPRVLLSGNHAQIQRWRLKQSLGRTHLRRPELLERRGLSSEERSLLAEFIEEYAEAGEQHGSHQAA